VRCPDYSYKFEIIPEEIKCLLKRMLAEEQTDRIGFEELFNHPLFANITCKIVDSKELINPIEISRST
jgi:serine/threonine protein kinase